jgi:MOSC domain-containing protein YiiM
MSEIQSINIAVPGNVLVSGNKKIFSGILKKPVQGRIYLDNLGFQGDGVADHRFHGGGDKAVCVYCVDHYPFWKKELKQELSFGAFGENLSVSGLIETKVHIGDVFSIGEAEVQCTQPRQPCHKLNKVFDFQGMACRVQTTGFSGYYLRVLKPGWLEAGEKIVPLQADPKGVSIETANDLMHKNKKDWDGIDKILSVAALSKSWRETFQKRLREGTIEDTQLRLKGV